VGRNSGGRGSSHKGSGGSATLTEAYYSRGSRGERERKGERGAFKGSLTFISPVPVLAVIEGETPLIPPLLPSRCRRSPPVVLIPFYCRYSAAPASAGARFWFSSPPLIVSNFPVSFYIRSAPFASFFFALSGLFLPAMFMRRSGPRLRAPPALSAAPETP